MGVGNILFLLINFLHNTLKTFMSSLSTTLSSFRILGQFPTAHTCLCPFKQYLTQLTSPGGSASPEPVTRCRELRFLRVDLARSRARRHKFSKSLPCFFPLPIIFLNEPKCIILELDCSCVFSHFAQDLKQYCFKVSQSD